MILLFKYYNESIKLAKIIDAEKMGYTLHSYFSLGKYAFNENDYFSAKKYFNKVIKLTKRSEKINIDSRMFIKKMR